MSIHSSSSFSSSSENWYASAFTPNARVVVPTPTAGYENLSRRFVDNRQLIDLQDKFNRLLTQKIESQDLVERRPDHYPEHLHSRPRPSQAVPACPGPQRPPPPSTIHCLKDSSGPSGGPPQAMSVAHIMHTVIKRIEPASN